MKHYHCLIIHSLLIVTLCKYIDLCSYNEPINTNSFRQDDVIESSSLSSYQSIFVNVFVHMKQESNNVMVPTCGKLMMFS